MMIKSILKLLEDFTFCKARCGMSTQTMMAQR